MAIRFYAQCSERIYQPVANYCANQMFSVQQRETMVNWLLSEQNSHIPPLLPESIFIAVNIMDRYLSRKQLQLRKLQLLGITALLIAAKF